MSEKERGATIDERTLRGRLELEDYGWAGGAVFRVRGEGEAELGEDSR